MSIPFENTNYGTSSGGSSVSAGTGISVDNNTITNTAPDQTLILEPGTGINITGTYPEFTVINTLPNQQSNFTQTNASAVSFISNKPIITTSASVTSVGVGTGANAEGNHTAFGKNSAKQALQGHLCIGEESGEQGGSRAISIGYKAHATNAGSTVISASDSTLSSSSNDSFFMEKLRTLDPNGQTLSHMKINMYNTNTKEIFNVDNLLVPGTCKINGAVNVLNKISINSAGAIGFGSTPQFGLTGTVLISGAASGTPAWGVLPYSSLSGRPTALSSGAGISIDNNAIINTSPNVDVNITNGTGIQISGDYPNKVITNTLPNVDVNITNGTGIQISGDYPDKVITNTAPNVDVNLIQGTGIQIHGTYPNKTITNLGLTANSSSTFNALTVGDSGGQATNTPVINMNHTIVGQNALVPIVSLNATRIGDNAGQFSVSTKALGGNLTERLRINNLGAVGFGGSSSPNTAFGKAGQVLTSSHDGAPPVWKDKTRIVKFIGSGYWSPDGTGVNDGALLYVKWPGLPGGATGWISSNPDNTFCEEYGVSGSSNSTGADGSIKILEAGQYLIHIQYNVYLHQIGFFVKGRLWKIPASNGANDFSSPSELGVAYITTNYNDSQDDIMNITFGHTELVDLTVGERLILVLNAAGSKMSAERRTNIIIQKVND